MLLRSGSFMVGDKKTKTKKVSMKLKADAPRNKKDVQVCLGMLQQ
jgi:hypothetical protein